MKAAWALLLCGCGAAPGTWPEGTSAPRWSLDGPPRVEILVDGVPALFDVDPEVRGVRLAVQLATRLGLRPVGDPARGIREARVKTLQVGKAIARDVVVTLVDGVRATVHGRPVVGVVGDGMPLTLTTDGGLERFGDHGCGPDLERCVRGRVTRLERGAVWIEFDRPERSLPPRMWARIDLGLPGRTRPTMVRLKPDRYRPMRLRIEASDISPETVRGPPGPIEVMDLIPLGGPCPGQVCQVE